MATEEDLIPTLDEVSRTFADRFAPPSVALNAAAAASSASAAASSASAADASSATAAEWAAQAAGSAADAAVGGSGPGGGPTTVDQITGLQPFMTAVLKTASASAAADALAVLPASQKGAVNGLARLDAAGDVVNAAGTKILPATVDALGQATTLGKTLVKAADAAAARNAIGAGTASTKTDVGLGSVDNTSDAAKPLSIAQTAAIAQAKTDVLNAANDGLAAKLTVFPNATAPVAIAVFPAGTTGVQVAAAGVPNRSLVGIKQA